MDLTSVRSARNSALDFTKGILLLLMVFYHWLNYFVSIEGAIYTYVRFITPSFIFLAGFLVANMYPKKYGWGNTRASKRLVIRGLKLLGLFTLLNVAANALIDTSYKGSMPGLEGFLRNAPVIYLSGQARAAFWVLVPIGYLLVLSGGIVLSSCAGKRWVYSLCVLIFICAASLKAYDHSSVNAELLAFGFLGMVIGLNPIELIDRWVRHPYVILGLNACYIFAVSVWGATYFLQVIGVCVSVTLIYLIGLRCTVAPVLVAQVNLLGEYSLFGYVVQIGVLQMLYRVLPHFGVGMLWGAALSFVGSYALTVVMVNLAHVTRAKWPPANWTYKAVFT